MARVNFAYVKTSLFLVSDTFCSNHNERRRRRRRTASLVSQQTKPIVTLVSGEEDDGRATDVSSVARKHSTGFSGGSRRCCLRLTKW